MSPTVVNDNKGIEKVGLSSPSPNDDQQTPPSSPNVIFILTDDQGYGELGCNGNSDIITPNIDQFAKESVQFTDFHVGTTCAPTRSGLLTGHYCNSAGVWHTIGGRSLLRENEWTLPQALKDLKGYKTAHFGKWHLGDTHPYRSYERGFDYSIYHGGGGIGNTPDAWGNDYFDDTYFVNGTPTQFKGYCTDVFFTEAQHFITKSIQENSNQPFYCYIATNAPHAPFNVENHYTDMYRDEAKTVDRACFYGMVTNIDENFGKLRDFLGQNNLANNTIVIYMSDNGSGGGVSCDDDGHVDESIPCNYNAGMRGMKSHEYEGGHRVPCLLHVPKDLGTCHLSLDYDDNNHQFGIGRIISELTSYIDFMPTILDLCGVQVPVSRQFHGVSLGPIIRGWEQPELTCRKVVVDTQRIARPVKWHRSCVMKQKWRLINQEELYNLEIDPSQLHNCIDDHPQLVQELIEAYEQWWKLVSRQFHLDTPFVLEDSQSGLTLSTHDIRNDASDCAWNQGQIRAAKVVNGYWPIDVRTTGVYRIELHRWPKSTGYTLREGIVGDDSNWRKDCIQSKYKELYEDGIALDLKWAHIEITYNNDDGGTNIVSLHQQIMEDDHYDSTDDSPNDVDTRNNKQQSVVFEVSLQTLGLVKLFAGFHERKNLRTIAPYYIYITKQKAENKGGGLEEENSFVLQETSR